MDEPQPEPRADICHRCLEPVPPKAPKCPHCGDPIRKSADIRVILGVFGLLMFLAVALLAFRLMQSPGPRPVAADDEQQQTGGRPDTPPPPEKKPALGQ